MVNPLCNLFGIVNERYNRRFLSYNVTKRFLLRRQLWSAGFSTRWPFSVFAGNELVQLVVTDVIALCHHGPLSPAEDVHLAHRHVEHIFQRHVHPLAGRAAGTQIHGPHEEVGVAVVDDGRGIIVSVHAGQLAFALQQQRDGDLLLPEDADVFWEVENAAAGSEVVAQHVYRHRQFSVRLALRILEEGFEGLGVEHVDEAVQGRIHRAGGDEQHRALIAQFLEVCLLRQADHLPQLRREDGVQLRIQRPKHAAGGFNGQLRETAPAGYGEAVGFPRCQPVKCFVQGRLDMVAAGLNVKTVHQIQHIGEACIFILHHGVGDKGGKKRCGRLIPVWIVVGPFLFGIRHHDGFCQEGDVLVAGDVTQGVVRYRAFFGVDEVQVPDHVAFVLEELLVLVHDAPFRHGDDEAGIESFQQARLRDAHGLAAAAAPYHQHVVVDAGYFAVGAVDGAFAQDDFVCFGCCHIPTSMTLINVFAVLY